MVLARNCRRGDQESESRRRCRRRRGCEHRQQLEIPRGHLARADRARSGFSDEGDSGRALTTDQRTAIAQNAALREPITARRPQLCAV
jgi:hypothetical protein